MKSGIFWLRYRTPSGSYRVWVKDWNRGREDHQDIIVDIFDIIQQVVRDIGIHLKIDEEYIIMADDTRK